MSVRSLGLPSKRRQRKKVILRRVLWIIIATWVFVKVFHAVDPGPPHPEVAAEAAGLFHQPNAN